MNKKNHKNDERNIWDVVVVGAGASGLMAAITASENSNRVLMLEHMSEAGKKILMTGNGKCNLSNAKQGATYYRGMNPAFVLPVFEQYSLEDTSSFFERIGVWTKIGKNNGIYPYNEQAKTVRDALLSQIKRLGIKVCYDIGIRSIEKQGDLFVFDVKNQENNNKIYGKKCIMATGGKSYKKTGSDGSGFLYLERLGHSVQDVVPALVPLQTNLAFFKHLAGIRAEISTKIVVENATFGPEYGELQLTDYGVSGICIFQLSRYASYGIKEGKKVEIHIDFLPNMEKQSAVNKLEQLLKSDAMSRACLSDALRAIFNEKLVAVFLEQINTNPKKPCKEVSKEWVCDFIAYVKDFIVPITGTKSFDFAQVSAGGVKTDEINPNTLESKLVKGLYFAGEMIDVDGMCGGYNLQWAWSSGAVAGKLQ